MSMTMEKVVEGIGNNGFSSLLMKFDSVAVDNSSRISKADQEYCSKQEKMYKEAYQVLASALESFEKLYSTYEKIDGYIDNYEDIRPLKDRLQKIKNRFIDKLCRHFEKTYKITISCSDLYKKYEDKEVTSNLIMDEIFIQLEGFSFEEKAVKEIKDDMKNSIGRWAKREVKKNKLILTNYVSIDHWDKKWGKVRMHYGCRERLHTLYKALTHFETGLTDLTGYYQNLLRVAQDDDPFFKYELGYNKVESIRPYQNGKIEIVFENNEQAEQFLKEYCGLAKE